ncbi:MAG: sigma-70 family RNA polymerase sigma factor [Anaerolineales bacterium]|nr:sigma-70 family RNA polymerase sigma factor [Anaerolineales bacterium]
MIQIEPEVIHQAQNGSAKAFSDLVETYQRPVYNLCYRMLGDPDEAEDAAQETFMRAYGNIRRYDPRRSFSTWLLSIAAHYCIDQLRKRRMTFISIDGTPYLDPPDLSPGPEAAFHLQEDQQKVRRILNVLSPQDRAAVVMYYWYDFSYDEIAQELSMTVSAVKSRLHRARIALAQNWTEQNSQSLVAERTCHESPAF